MGAVKTKTPDDPDPTPSLTTDSSQEVQQARRETQKKAAGTFGRQRTLLAGNTANNTPKNTILGG